MATEFNETTDNLNENLSDNRALVRSTPPDETESTATTNTDFRQQAQQYRQQAVDTLNRVKSTATEYLEQANDKFKDLQNKDASQIAEEAKDFARRKPMQAIAITAAAGLILGLILGRRR